MTGSAFMKRLTRGLAFLPEEEREPILQVYRDKLSFANTISEEEDIVKGFGSPERICNRLHWAYDDEKQRDEFPWNVLNSQDDFTALPKAEADPSRRVAPGEDLTSIPAPEKDAKAFVPKDEDLTSIPAPEKNEEVFVPKDEDLTSIPAPEKNEEPFVPKDEDLTSIPAPERTEGEINTTDTPEDVIFHKPPAEEKGHELVQSIEDHESFNLYGKKVIVKKVKEAIDLPAEEDDMTPEELEMAKQQALEKASQFDEIPVEEDLSAVEVDEDSDLPDETKGAFAPSGAKALEDKSDPESTDPGSNAQAYPDEAYDEDAEFFPDEDEEELEVTREYPGLFQRFFPDASENMILVYKILFSVLFSPVLAVVFGAGIAVYAALTIAAAAVAFALFLVMMGFVIGGVVELIYGITQLFNSVSIGLIEIGLGTILFGIVTAVVGLIYELLFGVLPMVMKKLTALCKKYLRLLAAMIYGGRA